MADQTRFQSVLSRIEAGASDRGQAKGTADSWISSPGGTILAAALGPATPFVYTRAVSDEAGSWLSAYTSSVQASSSHHGSVSEASLRLFDGWINTLAPWTQAGTATVLPQDGANGSFLAVGDFDTRTHGGWDRS